MALLNLLTKEINWQTRIKAFLLGAVLLLAINILRITGLTVILIKYGTFTFNSLHLGFWILGSTLFVAAIWITTVRLFHIEEIPVYSDLKEVWGMIKKQKSSRIPQ